LNVSYQRKHVALCTKNSYLLVTKSKTARRHFRRIVDYKCGVAKLWDLVDIPWKYELPVGCPVISARWVFLHTDVHTIPRYF
jgi:hypothetical protein